MILIIATLIVQFVVLQLMTLLHTGRVDATDNIKNIARQGTATQVDTYDDRFVRQILSASRANDGVTSGRFENV